MKFPALSLAVFLVLGIVAGRFVATGFPQAVLLFVGASAVLVAFGFVLAIFRHTALAWAAALLAWSALGASAVRLEHTPVAADHISSLVAQHALNLDQPLRWQGTLRLDPLELPWGVRYQLDLQAVQSGHRYVDHRHVRHLSGTA